MFDIFNVPIFGTRKMLRMVSRTYIMLNMGKDQAKRLINGAAWAWRAYVADYRTNPLIQEQLAGFASNHVSASQEQFYNLMCLAYGADPTTFADLNKMDFCRPIELRLSSTNIKHCGSTPSIWKSNPMSIRR